jgi:hypothetical protein
MKISRDQQSKTWLLESGSHVLYRGRKSPWDHPAILEDARRREAEVRAGSRGPRRESPKPG